MMITRFFVWIVPSFASQAAGNVRPESRPKPSVLSHPAVVCDAGSTGSRVFGYYVPLSQSGVEEEVQVELLGTTSIGISVYARDGLYEEAADSVITPLREGIRLLGAEVPIYIFATGGVRSLEEHRKEQLWVLISRRLEERLKDVHRGPISLRTLDGRDEALYGLLSSNYLLNGISSDELADPLLSPVGVLDLGGSSFEISLVGVDSIAGTHDDVLLTYKNLGMLQFRIRIGARDSKGVCRFGSESGDACRELIRQELLKEREFVETKNAVNFNDVQKLAAISGFIYAMDFAYWLMRQTYPTIINEFVTQFPNPSITSMREACEYVCSLPLLGALFEKHSFTTIYEAEGRCFDVCYVAELLSLLFDEVGYNRAVHFLLEARGNQIEWTLGFYLKHYAARALGGAQYSYQFELDGRNSNDEL